MYSVYLINIGSYPLSNPWSGFEPMPIKNIKKVKKKSKKRPKRNPNADASMSKTNPKMNSTSPNHINQSKNKDEPMVIPTLDDFFEFILTDQSGTNKH